MLWHETNWWRIFKECLFSLYKTKIYMIFFHESLRNCDTKMKSGSIRRHREEYSDEDPQETSHYIIIAHVIHTIWYVHNNVSPRIFLNPISYNAVKGFCEMLAFATMPHFARKSETRMWKFSESAPFDLWREIFWHGCAMFKLIIFAKILLT